MAGITEKDIVVEPSDTVDPPSYEEVTAASAPNGASAGVKSSEHAQAASWMTPSTATVTQYPQQHYHSRNSIEGQGQLYYGQYTPYNQQGVALPWYSTHNDSREDVRSFSRCDWVI
ncbi:uncharacterized protein [Ptychodera flava]|uniref:uncharacterized protein n=1 Tax=Ptychodera flava TaxID=63121 RepID=UPI003969CA39